MAKRRRRQPGEFISSWWEDDCGREEYVYGHVPAEVAYATFKRELRPTSWDDRPALLPIRHSYLRIVKAGEEAAGSGCEMTFLEVGGPGPGAMPVTIAKHEDLFPKSAPNKDAT